MSTIAEQLQELAQIKEEIRQAIINKGVTVSSDAAFSTYATAISQISGGGEELAALIDRSIEEVVIPNGVTSIGNYAFSYCSRLVSVTIPNSVTSIGNGAFVSTGKMHLTIPSSVTSLTGNVFQSSQIIEATIHANITSLPNNIFWLSGLQYVDLPSTLTQIGTQAFQQIGKLATIICRATTPPTVSSNTFGTSASNCAGYQLASGKVLYVPYGCKSAYEAATSTTWVSVLLNPSICNFSIAELNADGTKPNS